MLGIETIVTVVAVAVMLLIGPRIESRPLRRLETMFFCLAGRKTLSVVLVFFLALSLRVTLLRWLPVPDPSVHDEFSYLLAADTFASGRLTNPTHPMWIHFDSFHILQQPTYMSKFPPGQGLVLAVGEKLGSPWVGVLLSTALMCALLCWMLQAWVPAPWALLGGLIAIVRIGTFSYWVNSYWGGAVAAIGGALTLGACGRIKQQPRRRDAVLMGLGLLILANSRPYEGLMLSIPVLVALFLWLRRKPRSADVMLPLAAVLLAGAAGMGYYHWRVTGSPFVMPYLLYEKKEPVQLFLWHRPSATITHQNDMMLEYYRGADDVTRPSLISLAKNIPEKIWRVWTFFIGPVLLVPLLMLPRIIHDRRVWLLGITAVLVFLSHLPVLWTLFHYFAPATCVFYGVIVQGIRHLRFGSPRRRATGLLLAWSIPLLCAGLLVVRIQRERTGTPVLPGMNLGWGDGIPAQSPRTTILHRLEKLPGRQLVIVHYAPWHDVNLEWVYNAADIDAAKVVWARELDPEHNAKLLRYFNDRTAWLVEPDTRPPKLIPYLNTQTGSAGIETGTVPSR